LLEEGGYVEVLQGLLRSSKVAGITVKMIREYASALAAKGFTNVKLADELLRHP